MNDIQVYDGPVCTLGEGPLWSVRDQAIYWIDALARRLYRGRPDSLRTEACELPYRPACLVEHAAGGLLLAYKKGLGRLDFDTGRAQPIALALDFTDVLFNDGACDRAGRFWVGTMDREVRRPLGQLLRIDAGAGGGVSVHEMGQGYVLSNGIACAPDGRTLYHTESRPGRIDAYDLHPETGALSRRRVFLDYADGPMRPDGCTVDAEGFLWVAEQGASRVSRYAPDGRRDRSITLPVSKPTSLIFGGPDLRTLFITSMTSGLTPEQLSNQPWAGRLLSLRIDVAGVAEPAFGAA